MKKLTALIFCFFLCCCNASGIADSKPNILLIVLDDAGYGDVAGFADSTAPTPNLKQLGEQGVRFTRFYADSTCRPARVSLLTGKQASRVVMSPDFYGISPEVETLPEKLKQVGYATYHIGKWHLGDTTPLSWPSQQGFDHWFGFLNQFVLREPKPDGTPGLHRPTYTNPWLQEDDGALRQYSGHLEDILADRVVEKIHQLKPSASKQTTAPWFINYWLLAPHNPATASAVYLKQFPDTPAGKYQALLKQMDDEIGRALQALVETGQADNTIVLVLSDNGGTNERSDNNGPYEGEKGRYSEGGTRTPLIVRWPKKWPAGKSYDGITAIYDIYPTLLTAAGVPAATAGSDGIDLSGPVIQQRPALRKSLFWEIGDDYNYAWSVLADNGRWRLDDGRLFDLQSDPFARQDVASRYPQQVQRLKKQFMDWRIEVHRLKLNTETRPQLNLPDTYRITGDSFRRSPGYGGFTLVTSITPRGKEPVRGTLVEQSGMWSMTLAKDQRIHLRMHNEEMVSKPLVITGCTPLVFSTYYFRSKLQPRLDHGLWYLLVGGREVLLEKRAKPAVFPDHFLEPTYVGQDAAGKQPFNGVLEKPQFYNEFFYSNDPWKVERDPAGLVKTLCRQASG